jgi:hypothetical protein
MINKYFKIGSDNNERNLSLRLSYGKETVSLNENYWKMVE